MVMVYTVDGEFQCFVFALRYDSAPCTLDAVLHALYIIPVR